MCPEKLTTRKKAEPETNHSRTGQPKQYKS